MPTKTFLNLSEEKKQAFIEACYEEFALNDYESASLNNIVKKLDIAKGSIYQYFKNKRELYFYLVEYASESRLSQVEDLLYDPKKDFFEILIENFIQKIKYENQHPLISGFLYNITQEVNCPELGNMLIKTKQQIMAMVIKIIKIHQKNGKLRNDIDIHALAYMVIQVQLGIYDYIAIQHNIDFRDKIVKREPLYDIPEKEILKILKNFAEILKTGLIKSLHHDRSK